ncbi:MAG: hypothetical protein AB7P20_22580 [Rhizobiaceae bacterium]
MTQPLNQPNLLMIAGGYVCAVVTSAICAALIMTFAGQGEFMLWLIFGGMYIAVAGLPGFAATAWLARRYGLAGWLPFAAAGGANALAAWLLVGLATGDSLTGSDSEVVLASVRAGIAGGVAYWWFAYRHLSEPAS